MEEVVLMLLGPQYRDGGNPATCHSAQAKSCGARARHLCGLDASACKSFSSIRFTIVHPFCCTLTRSYCCKSFKPNLHTTCTFFPMMQFF